MCLGDWLFSEEQVSILDLDILQFEMCVLGMESIVINDLILESKDFFKFRGMKFFDLMDVFVLIFVSLFVSMEQFDQEFLKIVFIRECLGDYYEFGGWML